MVEELLASGAEQEDIESGNVSSELVSIEALRHSLLLGLAEQLGDEINTVRGQPLRQSLLIKPSPKYLKDSSFEEPHRRGEILVAAVLNAFVHMFDARVKSLDPTNQGQYNLSRVVEEAAKASQHLMTIVIRALDYCMPVHLTFSDYLSALMTSDAEIVGDDTAYHYRAHLLRSFAAFGIVPASTENSAIEGGWIGCFELAMGLNYSRTHFGSFHTNAEEVYRFIWENRELLDISEDVYTRVIDVRPCLRITPEGFPISSTAV